MKAQHWRFALLLVACLATARVPLLAQVPPALAGEWVLTAPVAEPDPYLGPPAARLTIRQDAATITIAAHNPAPGSIRTLVYKLDGSSSANLMENGDQVRSKARWQGATLVAEGVGALGEEVVTIRHALQLDEGGRALVVETSTLTNNGGVRHQVTARYRR